MCNGTKEQASTWDSIQLSRDARSGPNSNFPGRFRVASEVIVGACRDQELGVERRESGHDYEWAQTT